MLLQIVFASSLVVPLLAFPSVASSSDETVSGNIFVPPKMTDTGPKTKGIPFVLLDPAINVVRAVCGSLNSVHYARTNVRTAGMNTLANHGYIPRSGIVSFADIVNGVQEAFNMDYDFGSAAAAFAMLVRGNVLEDKLSIGGQSNQIPPLPKDLDGIPCGLAGHGKFEGDVSFTRQDAALGDHRSFQQDLFDKMLATQKEMGNGTDVVNAQMFQKIKQNRFDDSLARNPTFEFHNVRETFSFGEAGFTLKFFKDGAKDALTVPTMTSFFAHETFPSNWHRSNGVVSPGTVAAASAQVQGDHPPAPGAKNENGTYVNDPPSVSCQLYNDLVAMGTKALLEDDSTPQIKANTNQLILIMRNEFGPGCPKPPLRGATSECGKEPSGVASALG